MTSTTVPPPTPGPAVPGSVGRRPPLRARRLRRNGVAGGIVAAALVLLGAPASAMDDDLPAGRRILVHTVRAGETATGLAVRYHAWTAELVRHNHLGDGERLIVGQRLEIPVVVAALPHRPRTHRHDTHHPDTHHPDTHHPEAHRPSAGHAASAPRRAASSKPSRPARTPTPGTATVRHAVAGAAARAGVDPQLALAVSWQESGWQMDRRSSAGAIGAMQLLPASGEWMELYVGRDLHLHRLRDNAAAGATLLHVLSGRTRSTRHAVAAYYQGLGAVRRHGLYDETRAYVADVAAIRQRLEAGRPPA